MNVLFLYTELANYTLACFRTLKEINPKAKLLVIHFPLNPEAPFEFDYANLGEFVSIDKFSNYSSLKDKVGKFGPQKIVCCGWINKWYLRICKEYSNTAYCILALDNHWSGSIKQRVLSLINLGIFRSIFKKAWVPGEPQVRYAKKIGFREQDIICGFYSSDVNQFNKWHSLFKEKKRNDFPRKMLCVARYVPQKGYNLIWEAFIEWQQKESNTWELWCAGTGDTFGERVLHPQIKHLGFIQRHEWEQIISETGVFILGSLVEPWGVVVHEFAAAGYPLLLSTKVGAGTAFLEKENGVKFDPQNKSEIIASFEFISNLSSEELYLMGEKSNELAKKITPEIWANTLLSS